MFRARSSLAHAPGPLARRHGLHLQSEGDVVADRHVREQAVALKHHAEPALVRRQFGDVARTDHDAATVGHLEAGQQIAYGRQSVSQAVDAFMSTAKKAIAAKPAA